MRAGIARVAAHLPRPSAIVLKIACKTRCSALVYSFQCSIANPTGYVPFRWRVLITMAKLSAANPIVATRPLPRLGPTALARYARLNPACAPLSRVAATGMVTTLADCGIKNVVTIRATSVII